MKARRVAWNLTYRVLLGVAAAVDLVPPRIRFGHLQDVLALLRVRGGLPSITAPASLLRPSARPTHPRPTNQLEGLSEHPVHCVLVAGALDTGGIEAVVATVAEGMTRHGVATEVVCSSPGRMAERLQGRGIEVVQVPSGRQLVEYIRTRRPDVVELHRVDRDLVRAVRESGVATVPVFHAIETYLDKASWSEIGQLLATQRVAIAVSASVRDFVGVMAPAPGTTVHVIVNGSRPPSRALGADRSEARRRVGDALGLELREDRVVVSLARFSDQKNIPGLVDAFLQAVEQEPRLRLIVAGEPQNWLEVRRADVLRRGHPLGHRVHLLGTSDPELLLQAADVFALNSLAEGGPLAAVEAAAHGLPLVLSDVGFARQLVSCEEVRGVVVDRASREMTPGSLSRARRRHHQGTRMELSRAILQMSSLDPMRAGVIPEMFAEGTMVAAHASVLRSAARRHRDGTSSPR